MKTRNLKTICLTLILSISFVCGPLLAANPRLEMVQERKEKIQNEQTEISNLKADIQELSSEIEEAIENEPNAKKVAITVGAISAITAGIGAWGMKKYGSSSNTGHLGPAIASLVATAAGVIGVVGDGVYAYITLGKAKRLNKELKAAQSQLEDLESELAKDIAFLAELESSFQEDAEAVAQQ